MLVYMNLLTEHDYDPFQYTEQALFIAQREGNFLYAATRPAIEEGKKYILIEESDFVNLNWG